MRRLKKFFSCAIHTSIAKTEQINSMMSLKERDENYKSFENVLMKEKDHQTNHHAKLFFFLSLVSDYEAKLHNN